MRRLALCTTALGLVAGVAHADPFVAGNYLIAKSVYNVPASTIVVGQTVLPGGAGKTAVADASFPGVFKNETPDPSFGITTPIIARPGDEGRDDGQHADADRDHDELFEQERDLAEPLGRRLHRVVHGLQRAGQHARRFEQQHAGPPGQHEPGAASPISARSRPSTMPAR